MICDKILIYKDLNYLNLNKNDIIDPMCEDRLHEIDYNSF